MKIPCITVSLYHQQTLGYHFKNMSFDAAEQCHFGVDQTTVNKASGKSAMDEIRYAVFHHNYQDKKKCVSYNFKINV